MSPSSSSKNITQSVAIKEAREVAKARALMRVVELKSLSVGTMGCALS